MSHQDKGSNRRRSGRVRLHMVGTDLGDLCDLSITGARVLCSGGVPPQKGEVIRFTIEGVDGELSVCAKVVWSRRSGWFRREIGLEFIDLNAASRAALGAVARTAAGNQVLGLESGWRASA